MASSELPCPDDCQFRGITHLHKMAIEGKPKKRKNKRRRFDDTEQTY